MAYIDRHAPQNRGPILVAIAVIHVGLAYALVTGLVAKILPSDKQPLAGYQIDLPKMPPPEPVPQPTTTPRDPAAPSTAAGTESFTTTTETTIELSGTRLAGGEGSTGEILPPLDPIIPKSDPTPIYTPKSARPIGRPGLWVTPNDYPANDLRAEHEGTTRFLLSIGADGKAQSCEIVVSSGYPTLDRAACANVMKRSKFSPATDTSGAAAAGTYSSAVVWKIPKE